jgi:cyclopropane-fatty-acyl-phospholipid synthase
LASACRTDSTAAFLFRPSRSEIEEGNMGLARLPSVGASGPGPVARPSSFAGSALKKLLSVIEVGRLAVELPSGERIERVGALPGPSADIAFRRWRGVRRLFAQGDIGLAASYIDADWASSDIEALIELGARNGQRLMNALGGLAPFRLLNWLAHRRNANTRRGSRRNIEAHYDLGNEFYKLWLDARMVYSSAIFPRVDATLEQAQQTKLARIVEALRLSRASSVLEIGSGWGALAASIAKAGAARVMGVTISPAQLARARALARDEALDDRVEFQLQDYRDVEGRFDRIVSIEMIEAVGREFIPRFFETIRDRLKPGGLCVLQAITIAEDRFADYCRRPDFIQRFIFPGGFLPSKSLLREAIERAGLKLLAAETFGESYALTLREWRRRFLDAWPEIERLGFNASFKRLWEYYLCYCEAGFRVRSVDVGLYSLAHAEP